MLSGIWCARVTLHLGMPGCCNPPTTHCGVHHRCVRVCTTAVHRSFVQHARAKPCTFTSSVAILEPALFNNLRS